MNQHREQDALNAYTKFLNGKNISQDDIAQRMAFLNKLAIMLEEKSLERLTYATALNAMMAKSKSSRWHQQLQLAREFYPFWMQDFKAIASLSNHYFTDYSVITWTPKAASMSEILGKLKQQTWNESESLMLERYHKDLQQQSLEKPILIKKLKLAKIILLYLRDAPTKNGQIYRMAVDMALPLFRIRQSRQAFLTVIREFYVIWQLA